MRPDSLIDEIEMTDYEEHASSISDAIIDAGSTRRLSENALSKSTLICPNSSELPKNNARNITYMAVLIL